MMYEYSRSANKSKVTVSCETVKSRTHLSSFATMINLLTISMSLVSLYTKLFGHDICHIQVRLNEM